MPLLGVQGLVFIVYAYEDHSRLVVTRRDNLPLRGPDRRLGSLRLGVGLKDLAGLAPAVAVRLVAVSILNGLSDPAATVPDRQVPGSPSGDMGEQLTLDLALRV